jgi:hypothetical protein
MGQHVLAVVRSSLCLMMHNQEAVSLHLILCGKVVIIPVNFELIILFQ